MSDIVVGDVLAWEPDLAWDGDAGSRSLPLSWAVTIHATVPVLPPLRGGELIVVPARTLDHLRTVEMITWPDIARSLSGQEISGVVVPEEFDGDRVPGVPLLRAPGSFVQDAESRLNRTITEHRAELYRLGSDLSRGLSAASIGGADLDALLAVAGDLAHRHLVLLDAAGQVFARSRHAPERVRITPGKPMAAGWTYQRATLPGGEQVYLAAGPAESGPPEATRLVLSQTLAGIEAFLGPGGLRRQRADTSPGRESLLADLLLGRVPSAQLASRCQVIGIDPGEALRVALFRGDQAGFDGYIRTVLRREIRDRVCMLSQHEMAVLVPESGWTDWWPELQAIADQEPGVSLVRSEQQHDMSRAAIATRQARAMVRLGAGVNGSGSVFDVLLPVWDPVAFEPGPERLAAFADRLLHDLETHDRERGSELVETLTGYLAAGGSVTGAAARLSIHRNTLGYRLRRIGEITGANLEDEDVRLAFGLALKVRRIQESLQ